MQENGCHQQVPGHGGDGVEGGLLPQQNQTRVEQLISNAYGKAQRQDRVILTPKRRRVEEAGADKREENATRSWADATRSGAEKQKNQNQNPNTPGRRR